ncbi:N-acetylgalactosamine kinase-like [Haliotis asinina]|uniref:N-acetylgalactosamine kinase-like n=1 Tax=Haliotis asinina TaxID=109174 RepID=UPI00353269F3
MADNPPVVGVPPESRERYDAIKAAFKSKFEADPTFYARASGRVNLIGEHIDYCGYAVLPMAIEQDVVFAARPNDSGKITMSNTNPKYLDFETDVESFTISSSDPQWYNYALCGIKGVMEHMGSNGQGFTCMVEGTVPQSAGLSSSSALVCCAALTMMHANGWTMSKKEIADVCAHCERYIGTEGGGMDQAICFMAQRGTAKLIEFNPLRSMDVELPEGAAFVISNSCVESNKAATSHFNIRVVECRLATQVMAKARGLEWRGLKRLGDLQQQLGLGLEDMLGVVEDVLHQGPYSKDEVCQILGVTADELASTTLSANTLTIQSFKLYQRARHVYSEANRVWQFKAVCDDKPANGMERLGELMSASHESCRDLYQCSHPDLDSLVDICMKAGALGSRLTGAGWGGCAVSVVPADQVKPFLARVKEGYYDGTSRQSRVALSLFGTQPGGGAAIYTD